MDKSGEMYLWLQRFMIDLMDNKDAFYYKDIVEKLKDMARNTINQLNP